MSDPQRLLDQLGSLSAQERAALEAGRELAPPADAHAGVWQGLMQRLPPGPDGSGSDGGAGGVDGAEGLDPAAVGAGGANAADAAVGASAAAGAAAGLGAAGGAATGGAVTVASTLKFLGLGSGLAVVLVGGSVWLASSPKPRSPAPPEPASSALSVPPAAVGDHGPAVQQTERLPSEPEAVGRRMPASQRARQAAGVKSRPKRSVGSPDPDAAPVVVDARDIQAESRLIARARTQLQAGNAAAAMHALEQARSRFPYGVLVQEREALLVEALARSGRRGEAQARGSEFLRRHPSSPHASRVRDSLSE